MEQKNVFAGNPLLPGKHSKIESINLDTLLFEDDGLRVRGGAKILPMCDGRPLVVSSRSPEVVWSLCWQSIDCFGPESHFGVSLSSLAEESGTVSEEEISTRKYDKLVYLGSKEEVPYFAVDVSGARTVSGLDARAAMQKLAQEIAAICARKNSINCAFVDLRTLMVAAEFGNEFAMNDVAIAGHARALVQWHKQSTFCARCGNRTQAVEVGQRRQCFNPICKNKLYPRVDSVVIMLVIDKERDRVVLGRQVRHLARMWSCLAGFIETGESLEEAVRRETREEVGIEVGQIVYHSSQPWPVGPSSMACQLMVGFFAYAKSFDIKVDKDELQDAQWFSRDVVKKALTYTDYKNAQEAANLKVFQLCAGEIPQADVFLGLNSPMYVPGPYAIAHSLISSWINHPPVVVQSKV